MLNYTLPVAELDALRAAHRSTRQKRAAHRIKAVVLLATGWSAEQLAEVLQVDPNTVRNHFCRYQDGGVDRYCETFAEFKAACEELSQQPESMPEKGPGSRSGKGPGSLSAVLAPHSPPHTHPYRRLAAAHRAARPQPRGVLLRRLRPACLSRLAARGTGARAVSDARLRADDQPCPFSLWAVSFNRPSA